MEDRIGADVQIAHRMLGIAAKDQSRYRVAGSFRSVPQDRDSLIKIQLCRVKLLIRGLGGANPSTYS